MKTDKGLRDMFKGGLDREASCADEVGILEKRAGAHLDAELSVGLVSLKGVASSGSFQSVMFAT
jgi:hypothetical protein